MAGRMKRDISIRKAGCAPFCAVLVESGLCLRGLWLAGQKVQSCCCKGVMNALFWTRHIEHAGETPSKDADKHKADPNFLLQFINEISAKTKSLLLATATPVQVNTIEAF